MEACTGVIRGLADRNSENRVTPVFIAPDKVFISTRTGDAGVVLRIVGHRRRHARRRGVAEPYDD